LVRHVLVIFTAVSTLAGCTPSQSMSTPTPSAPTIKVPTTGLVYTPLTPKRIVDTRAGSGLQGQGHALGDNVPMFVRVAGGGLAPAAAGAVVLNLTAMSGTFPGFLSIYPFGTGHEQTQSIGWRPGETVSNLVTVRVGDEGKVVFTNVSGSVDVVADLIGYYGQPTGSNGTGRYFPVPPFRLLDTRESKPVGPGASGPIKLAGTAVPPAARAALLNVTALDTTAASYLAVVPGSLRCPTSGSNPCIGTWSFTWQAGNFASNRVIAQLGKGTDGSPGWISFFNQAGSANLVVDVEGWYGDSSVPATMGSAFTAIDPCRAYSRGFFGDSAPSRLQLLHVCGIPTGSTAAVINIGAEAVFNATEDLYIQPENPGCPAGSDSRVSLPNPPVLRYPNNAGSDPGFGTFRMYQLALTDGAIAVRNVGSLERTPIGGTPFSLDVAGYFTPVQARTPLLCVSVDGGSGPGSRPQTPQITATAFDTVTGLPMPGDLVTFSAVPTPWGAGCQQASGVAGPLPTDGTGSVSIAYDPKGPGICLVTARDRFGASASISVASGILTLTSGGTGTTVIITATFLRSDGTPHPGATLAFTVTGSNLPNGTVLHGCVTDSSGQCTFSYGLGAPRNPQSPSTLVSASDAAGLTASIRA
jgi:hypothetical protein